MLTYIKNVLFGLDHLLNSLTGGSYRESVSQRANRERERKRWACYLCRALSVIQKDHCQKSDTASD